MARTLNPKITPAMRDEMIEYFDRQCKIRERKGYSLQKATLYADDATASKFGYRIRDLFV